jgi:rRNA maturation endonuclease Nob1
MADEPPAKVIVADTSSLLEVRRAIVRPAHTRVLNALGALVAEGSLVFPKQVVEEVKRQKTLKQPDPIGDWIGEHGKHASRFGESLAVLKEVLAHAQVQRVFDPDKTTGVDEADPYVLALAVRLQREGAIVTVMTEDVTDTPRKLSLATACGFLRLVRLPVVPFMLDAGICDLNQLGEGVA